MKRRAALGIGTVLLGFAACGSPVSPSAGRGEARPPATAEHKLAFAAFSVSRSSDAGNVDIYVSDADGGPAQPLLASEAAEFSPEWSPDGTRLAFVSDRDEPGNMDLYVARSDGSGVTRITDDPAIDADPSWSPDGTRLVFARNIEARDEIFVVRADGTDEVQLTDDRSGDGPADWSPDGSQIAFARNDDGQVDVWLMNPDGTDQRRLTNDGAAETSLSWAPDGRRLAVTRTGAQGDDLELALIFIKDGAISQVTDDDYDQQHVAWSPDGDELVFARRRLGRATPPALYVLHLPSGRQHSVGAIGGAAALTPSWRR